MYITHNQAIGFLIAAIKKIEYLEDMDAAHIVLTFEEMLSELSNEEAEQIFREVWLMRDKE